MTNSRDGVTAWYRELTGKDSPPSEAVRMGNRRAAALMSLFLNFFSDDLSPDQIKEIAGSCGVRTDDAYVECVAALCNVGTDAADRAFTDRYLRKMIKEIPQDEFLNDPYYKTVVLPEVETGSGPFTLRMQTLAPCEAFVRDDFLLLPDGRMLPQIGFFMDAYRYPAVLENGREWMTLLPNEIRTTLPAVERAKGRVLTYGLGLGYYAFRASAKEDVSSVTVVEKSPELLDLFRTFLLPQFPHKDKIVLVNDDAFAFAARLTPDSPYDCVFADIWHDVGDGKELYLRFKTYEKNLPSAVYDYWLERTIRCYLATELW
ncbi:MAG: hypothetical protein J5843_00380 [Clostridia bacterium]|nr:hypothetical protein [Clostridia bacterium]